MTEPIKLKFIPLNFSWVALHPQPIGVIHFIGGAFFGTFPTIFYRYLLSDLFHQGYTIIVLPYRFTFRHWAVAINLVQDLVTLREAIVNEAKHRDYDYKLYQEEEEEEPRTKKANYFWLGHSLGCKYITLLELLTDLEKSHVNHPNKITHIFGNCLPLPEQKNLQALLANIDLTKISIENQTSILMAPAIEGIEGAIPFLRFPQFTRIKKIINNIGFKVEPSQEETLSLIQQSQLFNLTHLIEFKQDTRIAASTVEWLLKNLDRRLVQKKKLEGKHLAPLGWINGNPKIGKTVKKFLNR